MTVKPFFHLPQLFHFNAKIDKNITFGSAFGLGVMSGLTSSCCAPVLFAAVTLTSLSPTLIQALLVSVAYVLGIVFPLFILSLGYEKMTKRVSGQNRQKVYRILQFLGAAIFIVSGIAIIVLNLFNKIQMYQMEGYSKALRLQIYQVGKYFQNPVIDIVTFLLIIFAFYKLLKKHL